MGKNIPDKTDKTFQIHLLMAATVTVSACEACGGVILKNLLSSMESILIIRTLELILMVTLLRYTEGGFQHLGIGYRGRSKTALYNGIRRGLIWSLIFAASALTGSIMILSLTGVNPLLFLKSPLPESSSDLAVFLLTGAIISPIAEEFFFRGFIHSYFQRYGAWVAIVTSSLLFAVCHMAESSSIPVVPLTGGVVFAMSYEYSKSLAAPIIIHILGNSAIFTISSLLH